VGHAAIRENLMQSNSLRWLERLRPLIAGYHLHDAQPPARDHLMPPQGRIDFVAMREYLAAGALLVMEPAPNTPAASVVAGREFLQRTWSTA